MPPAITSLCSLWSYSLGSWNWRIICSQVTALASALLARRMCVARVGVFVRVSVGRLMCAIVC